MAINLSSHGANYFKELFAREITNEESVGANANGLIIQTTNSNPMSIISDLNLGITTASNLIMNIGTTTSFISTDINITNSGVFDLESTGEIFLETTAALKDITITASGASSNIIINSNDKINLISTNSTNILSTNLNTTSKTILLNDVITPTDINANQSGLNIQGDTNHTFYYNNSNSSFETTEHLDVLKTGGGFYINSIKMIDRNNVYIDTFNNNGAIYLNQEVPGTDNIGDKRIRTDISNNVIIQHYNGATWDTMLSLEP